MTRLFFKVFRLKQGDVVSIIGAGGKTSLMYRLAAEARDAGLAVLVTTSTRIFIPQPEMYDAIDLSGSAFAHAQTASAGIYVAGMPDADEGKMRGVHESKLSGCMKRFDLILVEADGSARKPLKGWKDSEPVLFPQTTLTIGVLDVQTLGRPIDSELVHRLDLFQNLTDAVEGDLVTLHHLEKIVTRKKGLFSKAKGRRYLFVNKVETEKQLDDYRRLSGRLEGLSTVSGSALQGFLYE